MIRYSLVTRQNTPSNSSGGRKVYAQAQYTNVMSLNQLSEHISEHNSKFNRADIQGVLTSLVDCIYELLLEGKRIRLGDMGTFYVSIKSTGADSIEEFYAENITGLTVKWSRSDHFEDIFRDAEFEFVGRRSDQDNARAANKQAVKEQLEGN